MRRFLIITLFFSFMLSFNCNTIVFSNQDKELAEIADNFYSAISSNEKEPLINALKRDGDLKLIKAKEILLLCFNNPDSILNTRILSLQDSITLLNFYIITHRWLSVDQGTYYSTMDTIKKIKANVPSNMKIINKYYELIFTFSNLHGISKENFNSHIFNLDKYEFGVFFLSYIRLCGSNHKKFIVDRRKLDAQKAVETIEKMSLFDGKPFYKFLDFDFNDFMFESAGRQYSFKKVYLNYYFQLLLDYIVSLDDLGQKSKAMEVIDGSILSKSEYLEYAYDKNLTLDIINSIRNY